MIAIIYWEISPVVINLFLKDGNKLEHGKNVPLLFVVGIIL